MFYSSHQSGGKRGVSILIHRQVNFSTNLVHKDSEGRFILVNGRVDGIQVSLMNIYAPNENVPGFMSKIFTTILQHSMGILLLGRDFNCVMSQFIDRQYPKSRDFTFCSHRHLSYSGIDLLFTSKSEIHRIEDIKILPITLSDHVPLELM